MICIDGFTANKTAVIGLMHGKLSYYSLEFTDVYKGWLKIGWRLKSYKVQ